MDGLPASGACASEPGCRPAPALPEDQESSGGKKHAYLPASAERESGAEDPHWAGCIREAQWALLGAPHGQRNSGTWDCG